MRFCSLRRLKRTLFRLKNKTNTTKKFLISTLKKCVTQSNDRHILTDIFGTAKDRFQPQMVNETKPCEHVHNLTNR